DCEGRKCPAPILGMRCDRMTRPDKQGTVKAKCCDRVGGRKLPSGKDRLHDFETMRYPVDARQQCSLIHTGSWRDGELEDDLRLYSWLGEALEGEHFGDFGEIVHRAVVNVSPNWSVYVVFRPNRTIREADLAPHRQFPAAGLAHLLHRSRYAV